MPSIYDLKPKFQALLRPITKALARGGVTANQVTVLACLLSVATGLCIYYRPDDAWPLLLVPVMLFVRMALNAIDGMLAREHDMKSNLGVVLNELGDVIADTALYLPLLFVRGVQPVPMLACVILAILTEMAGVVAVQIGASRQYSGPMGKSDRAFVFGVIYLLLGLRVTFEPWLNYVLTGVAALLVLTIINRVGRALKEVR